MLTLYGWQGRPTLASDTAQWAERPASCSLAGGLLCLQSPWPSSAQHEALSAMLVLHMGLCTRTHTCTTSVWRRCLPCMTPQPAARCMNSSTRPLVSLGTLSMICNTAAADRQPWARLVLNTDSCGRTATVCMASYGVCRLCLALCRRSWVGPKAMVNLPLHSRPAVALVKQPTVACCCSLALVQGSSAAPPS